MKKAWQLHPAWVAKLRALWRADFPSPSPIGLLPPHTGWGVMKWGVGKRLLLLICLAIVSWYIFHSEGVGLKALVSRSFRVFIPQIFVDCLLCARQGGVGREGATADM